MEQEQQRHATPKSSRATPTALLADLHQDEAKCPSQFHWEDPTIFPTERFTIAKEHLEEFASGQDPPHGANRAAAAAAFRAVTLDASKQQPPIIAFSQQAAATRDVSQHLQQLMNAADDGSSANGKFLRQEIHSHTAQPQTKPVNQQFATQQQLQPTTFVGTSLQNNSGQQAALASSDLTTPYDGPGVTSSLDHGQKNVWAAVPANVSIPAVSTTPCSKGLWPHALALLDEAPVGTTLPREEDPSTKCLCFLRSSNK